MLNGLCDSAVFIVFFIAAIRPSHGRLLDLCGFSIVFQCHIYIIDENYNSSQARPDDCPKILITHLSQYRSKIE